MAWVCAEIDQTTKSCLVWVEHTTLLPELTYSQSFAIAGAVWAVLATVWGINQIKFMINRS